MKLMTQYLVIPKGNPGIATEICRGMTISSKEGKSVGKLAAVAVDSSKQQVLCLILGHLPENEGYQSLPVSWVDRVEGETIFLIVCFEAIRALPDWHPA